MRKDINISGVTCHFKSSAAVPRMYRLLFKRDLFRDMSNLNDEIERNNREEEERKKQAEAEGKPYYKASSLPISSLEMFENIAFVMHKHGDPTQPADINEWLEQFDTFDIYEILPELMEMWRDENHQESTPKKGAQI